MKDELVGMRFGKLLVVDKASEKRNGYYVYLCKCDCGNPDTLKITSTSLRRGKATSCGCVRREKLRRASQNRAIDITGQHFGTYIALEPTNERKSKSVVWKFECQECKRIYKNTVAHMNSKKKPVCECQRYSEGDIAGLKFGKLTVIGKSDRKNGKTYLWECKCSCGNEKSVYASKASLKKGKVISCGCYHSEKTMDDLTGKTFNYLRADYPTNEREDGSVIWSCTCTLCNTKKMVSSANLKNGGVKSCGCHIRSIEYKALANPLGMNMNKLRKADDELQVNNTSGYTGVSYSKKDGKWVAYISVQGYTYRKIFKEKEAAIIARKEMKEKADEVIKKYDGMDNDEKRRISQEYYQTEVGRREWIRKELLLILGKQ